MIKVKDLVIISSLTAVLIIMESMLTFIPFFQLTICLLVLYSKKIGSLKCTLIIILYVIVDVLLHGTYDILSVFVMILGWLSIPLLIRLFSKNHENVWILGLLGILSSLIYSWLFIIYFVVFYQLDPIVYFINDIPYELGMIISSFLSIVILYKPLSYLFNQFKIN